MADPGQRAIWGARSNYKIGFELIEKAERLLAQAEERHARANGFAHTAHRYGGGDEMVLAMRRTHTAYQGILKLRRAIEELKTDIIHGEEAVNAALPDDSPEDRWSDEDA